MSDVRAKVSTKNGQVIGYFVNPKVEHLCADDWAIKGKFVDDEGRPYEKVEFNPQAIPYIIDLSDVPGAQVRCLSSGYVQRGRQPVEMTGVRQS